MQPEDVDERLTELEVKVTFVEDTLDRLNDIIVRQQQHIDLLTRELLHLRDRQPEDGGPMQRSVRDELPPHY